jgi:predicted GTPase
MPLKKVIIMGAAGRDYHNFNTYFKNNKNYKVVAFTAAQIPGLAGKRYPAALAGKLYPKGIPIYPEEKLTDLIKRYKIDEVVLSYSDLSHQEVMEKASIVNAAGADFKLLGPNSTMLKSKKPVIAICAVRTGCGKSPTTRKIAKILKQKKIKFVVVRHPMPYGNLKKQEVQCFDSYKDLDRYNCTIEEREEYEPHLDDGNVVYAGVEYQAILKHAEKNSKVILWDGGNNDFPFFKPDLLIVLTDPLRPGHELTYYPGNINARLADIVIINEKHSAKLKDINAIKENIKSINPKAKIIHAESKISVDSPKLIRNKRVIIVEDGPTLTHGGMKIGAGYAAAKKYKCKIVNPQPYAKGSIKQLYKKYKIKEIIPAMGYSPKQIKELQTTINAAKADAVIIATPIKLEKIIKINKPATHVTYTLKEKNISLTSILNQFLKKYKIK